MTASGTESRRELYQHGCVVRWGFMVRGGGGWTAVCGPKRASMVFAGAEVAFVMLVASPIVQQTIEAWLAEHPNVPGMIVLVRGADGDVSASAGFADRERTEPMTTTHVFRIASNTKTFVAVTTMRLVERDVFRLDQLIANLLASTGAKRA